MARGKIHLGAFGWTQCGIEPKREWYGDHDTYTST